MSYSEFKQATEKMQEIKGSTTAVARQFQKEVAEGIEKIRQDEMLSPQGRQVKIDEFKREKGHEFIAKATEMRETYDKAAISAQVAAEIVINDGASKPSPIAQATFERELADMQTSLMLETNADKAFKSVQAFVDKTSDAYLAREIKRVMPGLISEITSLAGRESAKYKIQLRDTVAALNDKGMNVWQKDAQQFLQQGGKRGDKIFLPGGLQHDAIQNAVGKEFAQFANNPQDYVDTSDI